MSGSTAKEVRRLSNRHASKTAQEMVEWAQHTAKAINTLDEAVGLHNRRLDEAVGLHNRRLDEAVGLHNRRLDKAVGLHNRRLDDLGKLARKTDDGLGRLRLAFGIGVLLNLAIGAGLIWAAV